MQLIKDNPYRTLGVFSGTSTREIQKQLAKVKAYTQIGKQTQMDTDFEFMGTLNRDIELVTDAARSIEQAKNKVLYALFWFYKLSPIDETALSYLGKNDVNKAIEIWSKLADSPSQSIDSKTFSALINLSTLYLELGLINADTEQFLTGIRFKGKAISSGAFKDFVTSIAGGNIVLNSEALSEELSIELLQAIEKSVFKLSFQEILNAFDTFPGAVVQKLKAKYTEDPIHSIEQAIERSKEKRKDAPGKANQIGKDLYKNAKEHLSFLHKNVGKSDVGISTLTNNLANELLQCSIDFFNHHQDSNELDPGDDAMELLNLAKKICLPGSTRARIEKNYEVINQWVSQSAQRESDKIIKDELRQINQILSKADNKAASNTVVEQLLDQANPVLNEMKRKLGANNEKFMQLSSAIANFVLNILIDVVNSIQNEHIVRYQTALFISTIKTSNTLMVRIGKMDMDSQTRQRYNTNRTVINNIHNQVSQLQRQIKSNSSSSSSCYIATMAYGDPYHPQVNELRRYRDEVLLQKASGRIFIKAYYRCSPTLVKLLGNNKPVNAFIRKKLDGFIEKKLHI